MVLGPFELGNTLKAFVVGMDGSTHVDEGIAVGCFYVIGKGCGMTPSPPSGDKGNVENCRVDEDDERGKC